MFDISALAPALRDLSTQQPLLYAALVIGVLATEALLLATLSEWFARKTLGNLFRTKLNHNIRR